MSIRETINDMCEETILFDGLDSCIIGLTDDEVVVYDYNLIIDHFCSQGMNYDEAVEWVDFNVKGVYAGEKTPLIIYPVREKDITFG